MRITKEHIVLVILGVIVYLGINLYLGVFSSIFELNKIGDTISYQTASKYLFSKGIAHPFRPIGIAFIFGLLKSFQPILIIIFQFFLWTSTILVIYNSLKLVTTTKNSFLLALTFLLFISNILFVSWQVTETITTFLLSLSTFYVLKYNERKISKYLLFSASIIVFLVIIKPGFYYIALVFSLYSLWKAISSRASIKQFVPLLFTLALLLINNSMVNHTYGKFKPSFIDDHTLYIYLGAYSQTEIRNTSTARIQRERRAKIKSLSYKEIHVLTQSDMKFQLEYHPFVVIKYWLLNIKQNTISGCNLLNFIKKEKNEKRGNAFLYWLSLIQNTTMVLLSIILPIIYFIRTKRLHFFWIVTTIVIWYIILTSGISYYQGDRFHIVFYPIVIIQLGYFFFKRKSINIA